MLKIVIFMLNIVKYILKRGDSLFKTSEKCKNIKDDCERFKNVIKNLT